MKMPYWDPNGLAWQQLANALWDVLDFLRWTLMAGLIASGAAWTGGQFLYGDWVREHPPPHLRLLAQQRLRRHIGRGLADLEEYLRERDPGHGHDRPARRGRSQTPSRHEWRRPWGTLQ